MTTKADGTVEGLEARPEDGRRYELVAGELRELPPPSFEHGGVSLALGAELRVHVRRHELGKVVGEVSSVLDRAPDTVRIPEVAFVRAGRLPGQHRRAPSLMALRIWRWR